MVDDERVRTDFGCEYCWPATPDAAWEARRGLAREAELIDESHFHVMILACRSCTQRFVSVFTETIDWADGEDPQYWTLLPLTQMEAADLAQLRGGLTEAKLNTLGINRRCLRRDFPQAEEPRVFWATGISVRSHD